MPLPAKALPAPPAAAVEPVAVEIDEADAGEDAAPDPDAGPGQASKRKANQTAQRAESQAACTALERSLVGARRKALSTLTGIAAVALLGLVGYGLLAGNGMVLASAGAPFLLVVGFLCWPRERPLSRREYLSLPHTQGRNGRLRCIHCSSLGANLAELQDGHGRRHECQKCRKLLFSR